MCVLTSRPSGAAAAFALLLAVTVGGYRPAVRQYVPDMRNQMDLFGGTDEPSGVSGRVRPAPASERWARVSGALPPRLRLGTSSWTFPGWRGIVYDGAFSKTMLAREGLRAYAAHPLRRAVGLDRTFYRPMTPGDLAALAQQVPESFRFLVKAPRDLTTLPPEARSGAVRGAKGPPFLEAGWARANIVEPVVEGLGRRAAVILFQFPPMDVRSVVGPARFEQRLERFLDALPQGPTYAVELRTPELFTTGYAEVLDRTGVAHAYNVHPRMVPLERQLEVLAARSGPAFVVRWMLGGRMRYEEARDRFAPFDRLVAEDTATRMAVGSACLEALAAGREAFVIANNKAEGSAPLSLFRLAEWICEGRMGSRPGGEAGS